MKKIKILLVEDNRILRDGIKAIIDKQADLRVVAVNRRKSRYTGAGAEPEASRGSHGPGATE